MDIETMLDQSDPAHRYRSVDPRQFQNLLTLTESASRGRRRRIRIQAAVGTVALLLIGGSGAALATTVSTPAVYTGTVPGRDGKVFFTLHGKGVACGATFFVTSSKSGRQDGSSVTAARAYVRHIDLQRILRSSAFARSAQLEQQPAVVKIPINFRSLLAAQQRALQDQVDRGVEAALVRGHLPLSVSVRPVFHCATPAT